MILRLRIVALKDTAQNKSSTRNRHSMALSTDSTTDTDNTFSYPKWALIFQVLEAHVQITKNRRWALCPFLFVTVP